MANDKDLETIIKAYKYNAKAQKELKDAQQAILGRTEEFIRGFLKDQDNDISEWQQQANEVTVRAAREAGLEDRINLEVQRTLENAEVLLPGISAEKREQLEPAIREEVNKQYRTEIQQLQAIEGATLFSDIESDTSMEEEDTIERGRTSDFSEFSAEDLEDFENEMALVDETHSKNLTGDFSEFTPEELEEFENEMALMGADYSQNGTDDLSEVSAEEWEALEADFYGMEHDQDSTNAAMVVEAQKQKEPTAEVDGPKPDEALELYEVGSSVSDSENGELVTPEAAPAVKSATDLIAALEELNAKNNTIEVEDILVPGLDQYDLAFTDTVEGETTDKGLESDEDLELMFPMDYTEEATVSEGVAPESAAQQEEDDLALETKQEQGSKELPLREEVIQETKTEAPRETAVKGKESEVDLLEASLAALEKSLLAFDGDDASLAQEADERKIFAKETLEKREKRVQKLKNAKVGIQDMQADNKRSKEQYKSLIGVETGKEGPATKRINNRFKERIRELDKRAVRYERMLSAVDTRIKVNEELIQGMAPETKMAAPENVQEKGRQKNGAAVELQVPGEKEKSPKSQKRDFSKFKMRAKSAAEKAKAAPAMVKNAMGLLNKARDAKQGKTKEKKNGVRI